MSSLDDIYARMDRDGKVLPVSSTTALLGSIFVGVPVWLMILPLSVVYQAGLILSEPFRSKPKFILDTGTAVDPAQVVPREKRKYDVVILGATGFTGKLATEHLAKTYGVGKTVKWAIAGRSKNKLEQVKKDVAQLVGNESVLNIDALIVDTSIVSDLPTLVKDTRVVVTTAGPFQRYGSAVVEFCAKYGTHYVDITGEVNWVQIMMVQWEELAQKTGAKIVSMCGNDVVPWDLTVMKLEEALSEGETLESVECIDEILTQASGGTVETVSTFGDGTGMPPPKVTFDPFLKMPDGKTSSLAFTFELPLLIKKTPPIHERYTSTYGTFFPLSMVNAEMVKRSIALRQRSTSSVLYRESAVAPDWKSAFCTQFGMVALGTALMNPITTYLLKKFILPRPGEGPRREDMESKYFLAVSAQGVGSKGTKVQSVMYFPRDSGYLDTARMVVESGLALALESDKLSKDGGFFTPSTGMGNVLLDRLCRTGTFFGLHTKPLTS